MKYIRRLAILAACLLFAALAIFFILLFSNRAHYDPPASSYGSSVSRVDTELKIAVIGDSWAAGKKMDQLLTDKLLGMGMEAEVVSYGHPGGKSRDVLRDLCETKEASDILRDPEIDIFVIMVGVNDSKGHDGPEFYGYHMERLLKLIASHGALAVIVDIPQYGLEADKAPSLLHWSKREASRILFDSPTSGTDNRPAYRSVLENLTKDKSGFMVIDEKQLPSYRAQPELWGDPVHLNAAGYSYASQPIAEAVAKIYKKQREPKQ